MTELRRTLGAFEAFTMSVAIIAPTLAMAFNVALAVQAAGRAAPLAFLIGGATMSIIGLSFVAFSRRIANAGSAYAYVESVFGRRWGFVAGWALLLAYLAFLTADCGLVGGFMAAALAHAGVSANGLWLAIALAAALAVIWLGGREIRSATLFMLTVEALAILAILVLAFVILAQVPLSTEPFGPDPERGFSGIGFGMVFAVLSFAGFEGATTVAEETRDPKRSIPLAVLGSVITATVLYVLVSYAMVVGYGLDATEALGKEHAPLDVLSTRFIGSGYAVLLDAATGIAALACSLGTASAAARLLYALSRNGLVGRFDAIEPVHGVPRRAARFIGAVNIAALLIFGGWVGSRSYSEAFATIGTLVLIVVYIAVGLAQMVDAERRRRWLWAAFGALGAVLLCWPLANSLYPVPPWPENLWPFLVMGWIVAGALMLRLQPRLAGS